MGNEDAVGCGAPKAVCKVEECLSETTGDVGEDKVCQRFVGMAQAACQGLDNLVGDAGILSLCTFEGFVLDSSQACFGNRYGIGGAGGGVEERHLAEDVTGSHECNHVFAAICGGAPELDLAGEHSEELVALVTLVEEHGVAGQINFLDIVCKQLERGVIESREKRGTTKDIEIHSYSLSGIAGDSFARKSVRHTVASARRIRCEPHRWCVTYSTNTNTERTSYFLFPHLKNNIQEEKFSALTGKT